MAIWWWLESILMLVCKVFRCNCNLSFRRNASQIVETYWPFRENRNLITEIAFNVMFSIVVFTRRDAFSNWKMCYYMWASYCERQYEMGIAIAYAHAAMHQKPNNLKVNLYRVWISHMVQSLSFTVAKRECKQVAQDCFMFVTTYTKTNHTTEHASCKRCAPLMHSCVSFVVVSLLK